VLEKPKTQIQNFRTLSIFKERDGSPASNLMCFLASKKPPHNSLAASPSANPRDVSVAEHI
jgi:hypothetical protein